ncbi:MAG: glycosyltransferase, partial [Deltaproteobacteria bacterium]|nr:glycosyltransferase [Deltaproteobacteria bacterium]
MDMKPLVSIIMNGFNGAKYLREAIQSLLDQTYENWELIVWDNQSKDDTAEIAKSYSDPRIRYFYAPTHTALGPARAEALKEARGEWVGFLDVDDLFLPNKLERQMAEAEKRGNSVSLIYCRTLGFTDDGRQWEFPYKMKGQLLPEGKVIRDLLLRGNFMAFVSVLFRRSALMASGGLLSDFTFSMDNYLNVAIASEHDVCAVDEYLCRYRVHGGSMTAKVALTGYQESIRILERWRSVLSDREFEARLAQYYTLMGAKQILTGSYAQGLKTILTRGSFLFV